MTSKQKILFIGIIVLALVLRLLFFKSVTFFYDQARDAVSAMDIWNGDHIKIVGPTTDIKGLNHGPLYWYLISPVYFMSGGNVLAVRLFLVLINVIGIFFIYDLTKDLFKKKSVALLSSLLYAISFEAIAYARWLSNPGPSLVSIIISFWSLNKLIQGKKWAIVTLLISWGVSIQLEFFLIYQIVAFITIWLVIVGPKISQISKRYWLFSILGFLITTATYLIAEIKFKFLGISSLLQFFKGQSLSGGSFVNMFNQYIERLVNVFYLNILGINLFLAGLLAIAILFFCYKKKLYFLGIWLVSPIIINFFSGPNANFINLGALVPAIIITSYAIISIPKKWHLVTYLLVTLIIAGNLNMILAKNKEGDVLFTVQKQMILSDELKVIDWIYKEADGKPFKLNTYTQPIFINSTWAVLFSWYGKEKYGYMPIWWGENQVDVPGSRIKFADNVPTKLHFLIIEPGSTGDDNFVKAVKVLENGRSKTVKTERIGYFTVEKREVTNEFTFTSGDVFRVIKGTDLKELLKVN